MVRRHDTSLSWTRATYYELLLSSSGRSSFNDPLLLPENESSNFDHHDDPLFPRPPLEPPDVEVFFDFEPDSGVLTTKAVKGISEQYVLCLIFCPPFPPLIRIWTSHLLMIPSDSETRFLIWGYSLKSNPRDFLSWKEFSISFIRDPLYPVFDTLLLLSSKNEDKVFKPDILSYLLVSHQDKTTFDFFENPMMMYEGTSLSWMPSISISIPLDQAQVWGIESGSRLG
nr:hypothetical protein [Tanacetum cinerariifolium]